MGSGINMNEMKDLFKTLLEEQVTPLLTPLRTDQSALNQEIRKLQNQVLQLESETDWRTPPPGGFVRRKEEDLKLSDLPEFDGDLDPEVYLDWVRRMDRIFDHKQLDDGKRYSYATLKLTKHASALLQSIQSERARDELPKLCSWNELKQKLKRHFVPRTYRQDLFYKFNTLQQGSLTVSQYVKEFEHLFIACECKDEEEQKIGRFVAGLNASIRHKLELQPLYSYDEACSNAHKIEKQLNEQKTTSFRGYVKKQPESYKETVHGDENLRKDASFVTPKSGQGLNMKNKGANLPQLTPTQSALRGKHCYKCMGHGHIAAQCPSKDYVALNDHKLLLSYYEADMEEPSSSGKSLGTLLEEEALHCDTIINPVSNHETLLLQRVLHVDQSYEAQPTQRDNLFRSRCMVEGRSCSLIIDGGSCTNVASQKMVDTLKLNATPHPKPYQISWLSDKGKLWVNKQVLVSFSMGEYEDQVLCDILPMSACAILLGRPWQFDKRAIHHGKENVFTIDHGGKRMALQPLPPPTKKQEVPNNVEDGSKVDQSFIAFYDAKEMSKKGRKHKEKVDYSLTTMKPPPFDVGDYVWLNLDAQKLHNKLQGKENQIEEGPFKVVHRENYDTFQILLGRGVCASFKQEDLQPCFDNT